MVVVVRCRSADNLDRICETLRLTLVHVLAIGDRTRVYDTLVVVSVGKN